MQEMQKIELDLEASVADYLDKNGGDVEKAIGKEVNRNHARRRIISATKYLACVGVGIVATIALLPSAAEPVQPAASAKTLSGKDSPPADSHDVAQMLFSRSQLNSQKSKSGRTPFFNIMLHGTRDDIAAAAKAGGKPNIPQWRYDGPPYQGQWVKGKNGNNILQVLIRAKKFTRAKMLVRQLPAIDLEYRNSHGVCALDLVTRIWQQDSKKLTTEEMIHLAEIKQLIEERR